MAEVGSGRCREVAQSIGFFPEERRVAGAGEEREKGKITFPGTVELRLEIK